jgi:hypothetical protein
MMCPMTVGDAGRDDGGGEIIPATPNFFVPE